jgi:hypothetical protein
MFNFIPKKKEEMFNSSENTKRSLDNQKNRHSEEQLAITITDLNLFSSSVVPGSRLGQPSSTKVLCLSFQNYHVLEVT